VYYQNDVDVETGCMNGGGGGENVNDSDSANDWTNGERSGSVCYLVQGNGNGVVLQSDSDSDY
jgi:hypothetical protein